jgi:Zinc binding domain
MGIRSTCLTLGSGTVGKVVERQTVKALLTESALQRLTPGDYRFCPDTDCHVVYFSDDGAQFATVDVRVGVWQKRPFGARQVCYCFGESETSIRAEIEATGGSAAVSRIREHIAAGRCACEIRNPRGACCLGDVIASSSSRNVTA